MPILTANFKASIQDILTNNESGIVRPVLISGENKNKTEILVSLSNKLATDNTNTYVEVKFKSKYSQREKRLEVVTKEENYITICKISNSKKFDKDAIELENICNELKETYNNFNFVPVLYLNDEHIEFFQKAIDNMQIVVTVKKI